MKRILILSRDYPPHKSGGVRRVYALARFLQMHGYEPTVVSSAGEPNRLYDSKARTVRKASGRMRLGWLYKGAVRWLVLPDENLFDLPSLLWTVRGEAPHVVLASAPPNSILWAGALAGRHFGCPWVADYRDPWTDHPSHSPPSALHRYAHRAIEASTLGTVSGVLAATESMAKTLESRVGPGIPVMPFLNGYDPEVFVRAPHEPNERIVVAYYGSFYGPIDPEPIVRAVARAGAILEHAGPDYDGRLAAAQRAHSADVVSLGYLSSEEAARRMERVDVLAMVLPDLAEWAYCRTQKLPEYLASGRPILALVPPGEVADLLRKHDAGIAVSPSDTEGAARAIHELARRKTRTALPENLAWSAQVADVARFLDRVISRRAC